MPDTLTTAPQAPVFNPLDPAFIADPYPTYRYLRETAPVFRTPLGMCIASRYTDIALVLRDKRFGKAYAAGIVRRYGEQGLQERAFANLGATMLVLDPPDHTRLRGLVTKAFTARRVEEMRPRIAALIDSLIDRVHDQGRMDVIWDFAHRLPVIVICDMLGIPEEERGQFLDQSYVNGRLIDPVPMSRQEIDDSNRRTEESDAYFDKLFERRRREPGDDLTTLLVQAEEAGDRLSPLELRANVSLLFAAGHETTANLIGNGLLALHRNPEQWQKLRDDPSLAVGAVEELLRYDSSVQMTSRVAHEDLELGGFPVKKGEQVVCLLGGANRDPAIYSDPERLDITRQNVRPLSFGGGIHHCLGAQLARLEGELAFKALVTRLPDLRLPGIDAPQWRPSFTLRGLKTLPAAWG
ncbi:cytochrome P450 [Vineibacter terrae]|uniref:cytochrome P450 n=1 Tax=Vineibacter terrae TaxID=2586908 RepID=UPI002E33D8E0|nr:cytochrome P450 [Vineibacter terrae]HEX2888649.1 cytochrome P450 [Vineibacter terrae]